MQIKKILSFSQEQISMNQSFSVSGFVKNFRASKAGFAFIQLNDGTTLENLQIIANNTLENYADISNLSPGCSIQISGKLVPSKGKQSIEMQADSVKLIGMVDNPATYPIQPKEHTLEYLREVAHLRPRTNTISSIHRIRNITSHAITNFFNSNDFQWVHTPILTSNDCEGAGELFQIKMANSDNDFFDKKTFLTVSGQLHVESYCQSLGNVYTFGPTFRAENSNTSRHLAEFWMVEPELAFANLDDCINLAIDLLANLASEILNKAKPELEFLGQKNETDLIERLENLAKKEVVKLTYTKAVEILQASKEKFEYEVKWGIDLQSEHERYLCEKYTKQVTVITDYPKDIKSFYMRLNDDDKTVAAMDILVPGIGEIIGGSQREERYGTLLKRMKEQNISPKGLEWYLDLRKYGSSNHAGFGLGLERFIGYATGTKNVRDVIPFPRTPGVIKY
jgi:asparaginyl-tRNA synthetase